MRSCPTAEQRGQIQSVPRAVVCTRSFSQAPCTYSDWPAKIGIGPWVRLRVKAKMRETSRRSPPYPAMGILPGNKETHYEKYEY